MAITKIVTVKSTEQKESTKGNPYLSVVMTDEKGRGSTYTIFDQSQWEIYKVGKALEIKIEKQGNYWNIIEVSGVADKLPPAQKPKSPPLQQGETPPPKTKEQEISEHVWFKELGEMIRAKDLDTSKGVGKTLRSLYYHKMFDVLGIEISVEDK